MAPVPQPEEDKDKPLRDIEDNQLEDTELPNVVINAESSDSDDDVDDEMGYMGYQALAQDVGDVDTDDNDDTENEESAPGGYTLQDDADRNTDTSDLENMPVSAAHRLRHTDLPCTQNIQSYMQGNTWNSGSSGGYIAVVDDCRSSFNTFLEYLRNWLERSEKQQQSRKLHTYPGVVLFILGKSVPNVQRPDRKEILWNQPRYSDVTMDAGHAKKIQAAMAGFQLPTTHIPDWAGSLSDDQLLDQVVNRHGTSHTQETPVTMETESSVDVTSTYAVGDSSRESTATHEGCLSENVIRTTDSVTAESVNSDADTGKKDPD